MLVNKKVVVITGAASGIGKELAQVFAENGAKVVLSDLDEDKVKRAAAELKENGMDTIGIRCDVTKENEVEALFFQTLKKFDRIDVLINNAGLQHVSTIETFPTEKFELLTKVMLVAPFIATKLAFPIMKKQKCGRIINMSSINGLVGFSGKAAYNSAKHGVIGLTKVAALEGAEDGITVNAVCPGYVDTPLVRGQLEDLAKSREVALERVLEEVIYPLVPQKRLSQCRKLQITHCFSQAIRQKGLQVRPL